MAFDSNYGIGKDGRLPWNLPSDLKHFKQVTLAVNDPSKKNAVLMGRKTWDSLPEKFRPLPGRLNMVLSRQGLTNLPHGVLNAQHLDDALKQISIPGIENIFVIGGAQIYSAALHHLYCEKLYVTHVQGEHGCDTFFPPISRQFIPISSSEPALENGLTYQFTEYLRH